MSVAFVLLALALLVVATVLWQRTKRLGSAGAGTRGIRIAIGVLIFVAVALALLSQLPVIRGA